MKLGRLFDTPGDEHHTIVEIEMKHASVTVPIRPLVFGHEG